MADHGRRRAPRRGTLRADHAGSAVWYTRYTCAAADIVHGAGFLLGAPTNAATYRLMETMLPMPVTGAVLVAAGLLIFAGALRVGASIGAFAWLWFAGANLWSLPDGAWGVAVFGLPAVLHLGIYWFVSRGAADPPTTTRPTTEG